MLLLSAISTTSGKEANMQDVKITFRVRVSDDESRVIIANPTTTDSISLSVFMGIIRTGHAFLLPAPDKGLITRFAVAFYPVFNRVVAGNVKPGSYPG